MSSESLDPRGALNAALIACGDDRLERAEDATLEALSRIRQRKGGDDDE